MRDNLEKILIEAGPNLFRTYQEEKAELEKAFNERSRPFYPIAFGIECGDGWFSILLECIQKLEAEILKLPEEERQYYHAQQIKEKFGTLRFYMSSETEEMSKIIQQAEQATEITCEICSSPGSLTGKGWVTTLCKNCLENKNK